MTLTSFFEHPLNSEQQKCSLVDAQRLATFIFGFLIFILIHLEQNNIRCTYEIKRTYL